MLRFRRKLVIVEAVQWTAAGQACAAICLHADSEARASGGYGGATKSSSEAQGLIRQS